jgi:hypothetical protein
MSSLNLDGGLPVHTYMVDCLYIYGGKPVYGGLPNMMNRKYMVDCTYMVDPACPVHILWRRTGLVWWTACRWWIAYIWWTVCTYIYG